MPNLGPQGTYQWQDVMNTVKDLTHQIPTTVSQIYVCDTVNSIIWLKWPWVWTVNALTPILAVNGQQDYPNRPSDFHKLVSGRIYRTDVSPFQAQPVKVFQHLEVELQRQGSINTIQGVSYEPTVDSFRLDVPLNISGTTVYTIALDYQQQPAKVTTLAAPPIPAPDKYFNVAVEGVLWGIYKLADDPRAGTVTINRAGDKQYSGQLGVFMTALEEMKRMEDSGQALDNRWPEEPLGWVRTGNPGIFPTI
jgi:hypothetical protein